MINVTAQFGPANTLTREVPEGTTIGQLKVNRSFQAGLGYGQNVRALIDGVEQGDHVTLNEGDEVVFETIANAKAS